MWFILNFLKNTTIFQSKLLWPEVLKHMIGNREKKSKYKPEKGFQRVSTYKISSKHMYERLKEGRPSGSVG